MDEKFYTLVVKQFQSEFLRVLTSKVLNFRGWKFVNQRLTTILNLMV